MKIAKLNFVPLVLWPFGLCAQLTINDNLSGASSSYPWQSIGGACLTAGNGTGTIPSCVSQARIGTPDRVGQGALRLTDAGRGESGGIISKFSFPSSQGFQVTFTTVTYGGNGAEGTGGDGMSFFLIDADRMPIVDSNTRLGSGGGSLGYSRFASGGVGIVGGYLGLGIDEYGNFSNPADTGTGGPGFRPNSVALRGSASNGYNYITGNSVQGSIASTSAHSRNDAVPITFNLNISRDGLLSVAYSRQGGVSSPLITNHPISQGNGTVPRNFHFGFAAGSGGATNIHEITCFKAAGTTSSSSSAGSNVLQSAKVQVGSQLYLAYYHSEDWWGQLTAQSIVKDPASGAVSINRVPNWDASCTLTGGYCKSMDRTVTAQSPNNRTVLTYEVEQGIPFRWASLPATHQTMMGGASSTEPKHFKYLRGARSDEGYQSGKLRPRTGVLGDIMNSSPTWVGPPQQPYAEEWRDAIYPSASMPEGRSYPAFAAERATRTNVVYVGANDGMLHGFRSGAYKADGTFDTEAPNDGKELLAYVPLAALKTLHSPTAQLDYSGQQYAHNAFVDATPGVGDLFYNGAWHTWLVSGMGGGGNAGGVLADTTSVGTGSLFALDITDPRQFSEVNAGDLVIGDWNAANVHCLFDTDTARCSDNLGNVYGTPVIRRMHNGRWAAIFGNGYNSPSGKAGVFILIAYDGAVMFQYLDTGVGSPTRRNGMAYVTPVDLDGDNVVDYLYGGDLQGNVWRFDVTATRITRWKVRPEPIYKTGDLPITTQLSAVQVLTDSGDRRLMLNFGSGQILPQTLNSAPVPNRQAHYLYGVWDWDMDDWNIRGSRRMLGLSDSSPGAPEFKTLMPAQLKLQHISTNSGFSRNGINGIRTISSYPVCWAGSTTCPAPSANDRFGWRTKLPGSLEQVVYNPVVQDGLFQVSTVIPSVAQSLSCSAAPPAAGFTFALTPDQGIAPAKSYFADALGNDASLGNVIGIGLSAVGTPSHVTADGQRYLLTQTSNGTPTLTKVNPPPGPQVTKRLTWSRIR